MGNNNSRSDDKAQKIAATVGLVTLGAVAGAVTFGAGYAIAASIAVAGAKTAHEVHETVNNDKNNSDKRIMLSNGGGGSTISKASSPVWQGLSPYRGNIRRDNSPGSKRSYYTWDYTHFHIEKYNHIGKHIGAIDPISGKLCSSAVPGRKINL